MIRFCAALSFLVVAGCSPEPQEEAAPAVPQPPKEPVVVPDTTAEVEIEEGNWVTIPEADRTRYNAVLLARVAINENTRPLRPLDDKGTAGRPAPDSRAMIQEQVSFAAWKGISLRKAIRWQSKYVSGAEEPKKGSQHVWTSTLPARGKDMPKGWIECTPELEGACDGKWEIYEDNWVTFRDWMIEVVVKDGRIKAECEGTPITWGCDDDDHIAIRRGLCVLDGCGDRNTWWARPGDGCEEPMRDILARTKKHKKVELVSAKEIMAALRDDT